ncbi:MAG: 3-deoxy-D-manno-octulosonic acid transferase [Jejuia sp.]
MRLIYNFGIYCVEFALKIIGFFNYKISLGVKGRSQTFKILTQGLNENSKNLWFHCASLGEYEQGLPVFERLRALYPNHKVVLSFFSPSGYEIRKNSKIADIVVYLPLDTPNNAKRFVNLIKPELTVFVKYDIWPNLLLELKKKDLQAILISASFRKNQIYFKSYGNLFKKALFTFEHIFTQNEPSKALLSSIKYNNTSVSGDTRFDRVSNQLHLDNTLRVIEKFKGNNLCIVVGSSWPEDEALFIEFINSNDISGLKFIIAPHTIKSSQIKSFQTKLNKPSVLYSERDTKHFSNFDILIIDSIGLLSKIYSYGDIAYVGGAMGTTGLHNTLEAAVFGIPVIIGHNHSKFPEAKALIDNGGMFAVSNQEEFDNILRMLLTNSDYRKIYGSKNQKYVSDKKGAVIQVLDYLRK